MQQLFGNSGYSVEILGIALAVLSFTGASDKIERTLNKLRDWIRSYTPILRGGLRDFLPTPKNFVTHGASFLWTVFVSVTVVGITVFYDPKMRDWLFNIAGVLGPFAWWKVAVTVPLLPLIMYVAACFAGLIVFGPLYIGLTVLWGVFWLLSRPPSGVMGSVGLVVTLLGPLMRFTSSTLG